MIVWQTPVTRSEIAQKLPRIVGKIKRKISDLLY